ncbi:MAG TPA: YfiR family protein [Steroidobacteraceae bacterium]|jgi:hypothetical protein
MLKWLCGSVIGGVALLGAVSGSVQAQETHSVETVKAAYLYRFAGYVEWPADAAVERPFAIVVVGDAGIARELRRLVPNHPVNNQMVQVREVATVAEVGNASMLYVAAGHDTFLRALAASGSHPILVVSDDARGLDLGSEINFVTVDKRVRFEVSLAAAERARLKISADLLSVAIRVQGGHRQSGDICIPFALPEDNNAACDIRQARGGARTTPSA